MSERAHTAGPWEWWTSNSWRRLRHSERGVSTNVLMPTVHRDGQADIDVSPEDMALIAAAPDLLEAAKLLEAAEDANANCDECEPEDAPECCAKCFPLFDDARVKRRLAIAKATGVPNV